MWPDTLETWATDAARDGRVIAALVRRTGCERESAGEAIQEAILRSRREYDTGTFAGYDHYRSWVVVVACNYLAREFRRTRWKQLAGEDDLPARTHDDSTEQRRALVREVIAGLPAEDLELVTLYFDRGWGYKEIAEHLGWSVSTAWKRLRPIFAEVEIRLLELDAELFAGRWGR